MLIAPAGSRGKKKNPKPKVVPAPAAAPAAPAMDLTPQGLLADWQKKYQDARTANETRYADILGGYQAQNDQAKQAYGDMQKLYNQQYADSQAGYADILKGYNERYSTAMGNLNNAGVQEAADINEASMKQGSGIQQNLVASGLAGTTIAPTMAMGVERERVNEQGRLNERIRKERLAVQSGLSGDTLNFRQQQQSQADRQRADMLAFQQQQQQMSAGLTKGMLDFKERREDSYPELSQYASLLEKLGSGGMGGNVGVGTTPGGAMGGGVPTAPAAPVKTNNPTTDSMDELQRQYNNYKTRYSQRPGQMAWGAQRPNDFQTWLNSVKQYGYAGAGA
jgi:hypothetical protein